MSDRQPPPAPLATLVDGTVRFIGITGTEGKTTRAFLVDYAGSWL